MRTPVRPTVRRPHHRSLPAALILALVTGLAGATTDTEFAARVMAARVDSGADPRRALLTLQALRGELPAREDLGLRLTVDEAECRVLTDQDAARALAVADAGMAAAGPDPAPPARPAWLRLRACRAGMLVEVGRVKAARDEFEALLARAAHAPEAGVHALALLERGVHRSRSGEWDLAQQDLLVACEQLSQHGPARDHELCLGHLASHYLKVGDADEAARLLLALNAAARARRADFDLAVYSYGIGQAQQGQQRWAEAIQSFQDAADVSRRIDDELGIAYAENAIADSQLNLGRAQEALAWADRSLARLSPDADPRQHETSVITRSTALAALGRAAEANAGLERIEASVRKRDELPRLAHWLEARISALGRLGRWREAYEGLVEARGIEARLQEQRLSRQSARLRMQFNRERDAEDISALRRINEQGQRLRQTQAVALVLFLVLLLAVLVVAVRRFHQAGHLQNLASTDELTGVANRRSLMIFADHAVEQARRKAAPLATLMIDIDHFKRINDGHGHAVGDQVLRHVSRVLASTLRDHDRLGRVGGEEFVAMLPGASAEQARQVAERMRRAVNATALIGPAGEVRFTVSVGVASLRSGESASALVARADAAMYRAKNGGRNAVAVDDDTSKLPPSAA